MNFIITFLKTLSDRVMVTGYRLEVCQTARLQINQN